MGVRLKIFILIVLLAVAVFYNSFNNSFHFDDSHYIVENPYIRDLRNIPSFFLSSRYSSFDRVFTGHYRPLLVTSYGINYAINRLNPVGYHLVNLLFHLGSAFLVFLIVEEMLNTGRRLKVEGGDKIGNDTSSTCNFLPTTFYLSDFFAPFMAGLIFLVHPFNSEVVNYITARSSVMCSFFYLLSFYMWIRFRGGMAEGGRGRGFLYIVSVISFILAMLTKEIAITLPVVLVVWDFYYSCASEKGTDLFFYRKINLSPFHYLPYILFVAIPYILYRLFSFGNIAGGKMEDFYRNIITQPVVLLKYLQLLLFPYGMTIDHDIKLAKSILTPSVIASIIGILVILCGAYLLCRRGGDWKVLSFFIVWFFITLLPTTIIPLNAVLQENRGYLAGIVFPVSIGIILGRLNPRVYLFSLVVMISMYSVLTLQRNSVWKNEYTLWADAVAKAPNSARAHDNLGLAYIERKEYEMALAEFKKTLELNPRYYLAYYNAGVVYQLKGELDLARYSYEECIRLNPRYFRAYYNLGIVYRKFGETGKAVSMYEKAISIDPRHPFVYNNLGVAFMAMEDMERAEEAFKKAIEVDPSYVKSYYNLGNIYYRTGRYRLAREAYRSALRIEPTYKEAERMLELTPGVGSR